MTEEEITKMLDEAGLSRDTKLNFEDFCKFMSQQAADDMID